MLCLNFQMRVKCVKRLNVLIFYLKIFHISSAHLFLISIIFTITNSYFFIVEFVQSHVSSDVKEIRGDLTTGIDV